MSNTSRQRFYAVANGRINGAFYDIWENITILFEGVEEPVIEAFDGFVEAQNFMFENGIIVEEVLDMEEAEDILGLMDWNPVTPSKPQNLKISKPMSPKYEELKEKCRSLGL